MRLTEKTFLLGISIFLIGLFFIIEINLQHNSKNNLEVSFLNIGQGDSTLINYQNRYQILIDGGPDGKKVLTELSQVMPFSDNKIEILIITHPDRDHFVGLLDVVKKYKIGLVLFNGQKSNDELWQELNRLIMRKGILKETVLEGSKLTIGSDFKIDFFNPDKISLSKKAKNDSSIVTRMDYKNNSFLFTGDAGYDAEADMIFDKEDIDVDWLKVGHHGSKNSSSKFFLARVTPKFSIISVGKNNYGHPTSQVINLLKNINSKILRTDKSGTIRIGCNDICKVLPSR